MIWLLVAVTVDTVILLLAMGYNTVLLMRKIDSLKGDHAKCIAHLSQYVGDEWASQVLYATAQDLDKAPASGELERIANTTWKMDGPSVIVLWLMERAAAVKKAKP